MLFLVRRRKLLLLERNEKDLEDVAHLCILDDFHDR